MHGTRLIAALCIVACLTGLPFALPQAGASPAGTPTPAPSSAALDVATARVLELEEAIEAHQADRIALEERIAVTNIRIVQQQEILAAARRDLESAQSIYQTRMVEIYKSHVANPFVILLSSQNISEFHSRLTLFSRIVEQDRRAFEDAVVAASNADFQAAYLDDLKAQEIALRQMHEQTADTLRANLSEQQRLVARLTSEARQALLLRQQASAKTRAEWLANSVPLNDTIATVTGKVEPYGDRVYLVSEHQPRRYRSLGRTESVLASWYGNEFHGRMTASGQIFNQNDFTTASRTLPFGTRLALTRGDRRIVVVVTDRGPFIAGRDLDLSRGAARALGFSGLATIHVEYVEVVED